jgi:hypothetical protein
MAIAMVKNSVHPTRLPVIFFFLEVFGFAFLDDLLLLLRLLDLDNGSFGMLPPDSLSVA